MATSSRSMADRSRVSSHADVGTFEVGYTGPFSLAASIRFLEGFTPAGYESSSPDHFDLAFCAGPLWHPVAVRVAERAGKVIGSFVGDVSPEAVASDVARILSLDVDAREFPEVGQRDDVVAGLQAKYPGLRPVCFWTPYEAACWAVIGHRIRMTQAAALKAKMAQRLGHAIVLAGATLFCFPSPPRLVDLEGFPGLSGRKPEWLRGIARAALEGRLDSATLRALPRSEAHDQLKELGGIGDFSAELILLRGAGDPDWAPRHEPRLINAMKLAYDRADFDDDEIGIIASGWAPYRTWVSLLLRVNLEDSTHDISGTRRRAARREASSRDSPPPGAP
jgi:DNA-3-methyladenine glycosylase II